MAMKKRNTILVGASLVTAMVNCALIASGSTLWPAAVALDGLISLTLLICLWLAPMSLVHKGILILSIIIGFMAVFTRADMIGVKSTEKAILIRDVGNEGTGDPAKSGSHSEAGGAPTSDSRSSEGASVHFAGKDDNGGWAERINTSLDRQVGGPKASEIRVSGSVASKDSGVEHSIVITWSVAIGSASVQCGQSSIVGFDEKTLGEQIARPIKQAISRSVEVRQPACY
jgi:hypothetical protein